MPSQSQSQYCAMAANDKVEYKLTVGRPACEKFVDSCHLFINEFYPSWNLENDQNHVYMVPSIPTVVHPEPVEGNSSLKNPSETISFRSYEKTREVQAAEQDEFSVRNFIQKVGVENGERMFIFTSFKVSRQKYQLLKHIINHETSLSDDQRNDLDKDLQKVFRLEFRLNPRKNERKRERAIQRNRISRTLRLMLLSSIRRWAS